VNGKAVRYRLRPCPPEDGVVAEPSALAPPRQPGGGCESSGRAAVRFEVRQYVTKRGHPRLPVVVPTRQKCLPSSARAGGGVGGLGCGAGGRCGGAVPPGRLPTEWKKGGHCPPARPSHMLTRCPRSNPADVRSQVDEARCGREIVAG